MIALSGSAEAMEGALSMDMDASGAVAVHLAMASELVGAFTRSLMLWLAGVYATTLTWQVGHAGVLAGWELEVCSAAGPLKGRGCMCGSILAGAGRG